MSGAARVRVGCGPFDEDGQEVDGCRDIERRGDGRARDESAVPIL